MNETDAYRQKAMDSFDGRCDRCGREKEPSEVEVHHVDRDHGNDNLDNLEVLCESCHQDEHYGDSPMWGLLVEMPRPVLELVDEAVERHGFASRSEAINRALVDAYETNQEFFGGPEESVDAWFDDEEHTRYVSDAVVSPGSPGAEDR